MVSLTASKSFCTLACSSDKSFRSSSAWRIRCSAASWSASAMACFSLACPMSAASMDSSRSLLRHLSCACLSRSSESLTNPAAFFALALLSLRAAAAEGVARSFSRASSSLGLGFKAQPWDSTKAAASGRIDSPLVILIMTKLSMRRLLMPCPPDESSGPWRSPTPSWCGREWRACAPPRLPSGRPLPQVWRPRSSRESCRPGPCSDP